MDVDNSKCLRSYYIRSTNKIECECIEACEQIDNYYYMQTKKVPVSKIHAVAKSTLESDPLAFFAGVEE